MHVSGVHGIVVTTQESVVSLESGVFCDIQHGLLLVWKREKFLRGGESIVYRFLRYAVVLDCRIDELHNQQTYQIHP
jgi:hypothetical protein